jgi:hypothetical protein
MARMEAKRVHAATDSVLRPPGGCGVRPGILPESPHGELGALRNQEGAPKSGSPSRQKST